MQPLTKWLLGALFAVIMLLTPAFTTFVYNSLAEDIKSNEKQIEKLTEAVNEIKTQGKVNEALQSEQTKVLQAILEQVKNGRRPGS